MKKVELPEIEQPTLPSHHQIGDYVHVVVSRAASEADEESILYHGRVIKVHFAPGKVTYDLEFTVTVDTKNKKRYVTRIHNVDGALCCSLEEYEASKKEAKEDCLSSYTEASPFNHGGWHNASDLPKATEGDGSYASVEVLCDVNGKRKDFRVGWYDFEDKEWRFHDTDRSWLEEEHLKWAYLPLA